MKKLLAVFILLAMLSGCAPGSLSSGQTAAPSGAASPTDASTVSVAGGNPRCTLSSLSFINDTAGWVIRDTSNQTSSVLLGTSDGGASWQTLYRAAGRLYSVKFTSETAGWAISDTKGGTSYALLKTDDGGRSWSVRWTGGHAGADGAYCELASPGGSSGYAIVGGALLATCDGGRTWISQPVGASGFIPQSLSFTDSVTGRVLGTQGTSLEVWRTGDGGNSWNREFSRAYESGPIKGIGIDFVDKNTGWFLTSDMSLMTGQLYATADGGKTWSPVTDIQSGRPIPHRPAFVSAQVGWLPLSVGAGPISGGLSVTRDGGKTWRIVGQSSPDDASQPIYSALEVVFTSAQTGWAIGENVNSGDYLLKTTDGGASWRQLYPQLIPVTDMSFVDSQRGFGIGTLADAGDVLATADGGKSWSVVSNLTGRYDPMKISFTDAENGWMLAAPNGSSGLDLTLLITSDGGVTWREQYAFKGASNAFFFRFFDGNSGLFIAETAAHPAYVTSDGGKTWDAAGQSALANETNMYAFASARTGWQISNPGNYETDYDIRLSPTADGGTWGTPAEVESGAAALSFYALSDKKLFLLTEKPPFQAAGVMSLLVSADGGASWQPRPFNGNVNSSAMTPVKMQFADEDHGWILTDGGLLGTSDGGQSWSWLAS